MRQGIVDCARLGLTLVLFEVGEKLLLGFFAIEQKFLPSSESQAANVAIGDAGGGSNESYNLQTPF
jgi:hypothetical protein